jgi:hypothetical protein
MAEEYIDTAETARILNVPTATLRYWRMIRYGPRSARFGRGVRYSRREVEAWAAQQFKEQGAAE